MGVIIVVVDWWQLQSKDGKIKAVAINFFAIAKAAGRLATAVEEQLIVAEVWSYFEDPWHSETSLVATTIIVVVVATIRKSVISAKGLPLSIYAVRSIAPKAVAVKQMS